MVEQFAAMAGEDFSDLLGVRPAMLELLHAVIRLRGPRSVVALTAPQLEQITQPVQLIWGERDPSGPPEVGEQAAAIIPDAEFHLIPGAGHLPWVAHAGPAGGLAVPFLLDTSLAH